jgi:hypothetical protein
MSTVVSLKRNPKLLVINNIYGYTSAYTGPHTTNLNYGNRSTAVSINNKFNHVTMTIWDEIRSVTFVMEFSRKTCCTQYGRTCDIII